MYFFYYFPVGTDAGIRRFPVLTAFFSLVCVAVFVVMKYFPSATDLDFYNYIYYPGYSGWGAMLAAAFLHFGYVHLIGNLIYLLLFGSYVEDRLGPARFAILFVGSTVVGNLLQGLYNESVLGVQAGIVGASGAVSGVLGAFLVRLYRSRIRIAWWVFAPLLAYTRAGRSYLPAVAAVALWVFLQVVRGLLQFEGASANVAHVTHLAGFLFGVMLTIATGGLKAGRLEAHLIKARAYLRSAEFYGAQDELSAYLKHRPFAGEVHAQLARVLVQTGDNLGARAEYLKACEMLLTSGKRGLAEDLYSEAIRGYGDFVLTSEPQLNLAFGLERNLKLEVALKAYQNFVNRFPRHTDAAFALLRMANLHRASFGQPDQARMSYQRLIEQYPEDSWVDFAREQVRMLA